MGQWLMGMNGLGWTLSITFEKEVGLNLLNWAKNLAIYSLFATPYAILHGVGIWKRQYLNNKLLLHLEVLLILMFVYLWSSQFHKLKAYSKNNVNSCCIAYSANALFCFLTELVGARRALSRIPSFRKDRRPDTNCWCLVYYRDQWPVETWVNKKRQSYNF